ncbi:ABC transporter substrate-binding protein [Halomarina oriensis]|uniref:ABC transporter substrate-binding protein n=1 Tax=Halomarina oriensis TaxID=671145 RepID=A0A6B0GMJ7_9EURY|nr:ABC transporter substrate-binding protein [Halomarina oriensis]MWG35974.1 ABC transporter substrate-binding protein [Halomarina oriensis]
MDSDEGTTRGRQVKRRRFLEATGAGVAGVTLAGCVSTGGDDGGGGDGGSTGDTDSGGGTTTGTASGGSLPDTVSIGVLAPEPSSNPIGASIANAAELAVTQLNEEGSGPEFEVSVKDTREQPDEGRSKYRELTIGEEVDMTTGIFTSEVLLAVLDDIANQQTVHMTTGAATPEASARVRDDYESYKYHFRTGPLNAYQLGVNMIDFLEAKQSDLGWESVAVLVEDYEWTKPVSQALDDEIDRAGVEVAMQERYASGTENFTPIYDQVESSDADAALIAMAHTGTPAVVQWAKQQRPFEFGGIHVPMQLPSYYEATSGACNFGVTQNSATPQSEVTEKTVPFSEAYNEQYDSYPVYTGYITFDAVKQYADVVQQAGSVEADAVVSGLEESSFLGTAGTIEYYPPDNEFAHDVVYEEGKVDPVFQQWQDGNQEVIYPDDLTTADYQKPSWL